MKNGEFCNREVVIAEKDATILELARLMRENHTGDVIIIQKVGTKTVPIGIVTDRDIIIKVIAEDVPMSTLSAGDIMSLVLHASDENNSIWDTLDIMRNKGIRRVPVVNDQNDLQGILTVDDILEIIADEMSALAKTIKQERSKEKVLTG